MSERLSGTGREGRPDKAALVIAAALAGIAALIAWSTYGATAGGMRTQIGPKVFPYVIAGVLAVLALATAVSAFRGDFPARERDEIGPIVWIIGGLVAQMLLLTTAGFSIATGLLFAATAAAFGRRRLWITIPLGILVSFAIFVAFALGLQLSLPRGPLERLIFS